MNRKKGITMMSIVVYVILLAAFTGITLAASNNLSNSFFLDKGVAQNMTHYEKTLYYLNKSALESDQVIVDNKSITFLNGDVFKYDETRKEITLNGGVLCKNVSSFDVENLGDNLLNIYITYNKYTHSMDRTITIYVGE